MTAHHGQEFVYAGARSSSHPSLSALAHVINGLRSRLTGTATRIDTTLTLKFCSLFTRAYGHPLFPLAVGLTGDADDVGAGDAQFRRG